ncbi:SGNH/GDSL hydrolase family protein [Pseudomonas baetica]|uniref:SGNH/GDSL hydrolase family protein n=1 Tax=Pseudomonas baetica TaxID=674054 RepID=UPI0024075550|nr:SGNH/GDSL hydrolase family protein [Pseudomonas baetica]MDF9773996.1 lysophospholipase L1-like esterase [Pseudomonas baetica]
MSRIETLAKILLGPVLLAQGLYTRRVTPRLPEAEGERQGEVGSGDVLRLLIVGDSAAADVGAATQGEAPSGRLVERLADDYQVAWKLWARTGLDAQGLLELLEQHAPEPFDVALLSIGVNDVTSTLAVDQWLARQRRLMASDGFHPGPLLYRQWAEDAARVIDQRFRTTTIKTGVEDV